MGSTRNESQPILVVCADGSARRRLVRAPGMVVVADCSECEVDAEVARHEHQRWRVQTDSVHLIGDLSLTSRREGQAAAVALGCLAIDWRDARGGRTARPEIREAALSVARPVGLARAAA